MKKTSENPHIHDVPDAQFVLHPEDNDVFIRTGRQIIEACRLSISVGVWLEELKEMCSFLAQWCTQRQDKIQACVAVGRGSKVMVFFVPHGSQFNFDLADELPDLNRELVTRFNIGMVEVGQIPHSEIERFIDLETARQIYGQIIQTSRTVEA